METTPMGQTFYREEADAAVPRGCTCHDKSGSCDWCQIYYDGPEKENQMEATLETNHGPMTPAEIVADLTYSCYAYNRTISPDITPERWERVFGSRTMAMEARYQKERQPKPVAVESASSYNPDALVEYHERRGGCYDE